MSPLVGVQIGLFKELSNESILSVAENKNMNYSNQFSTITEEASNFQEQPVRRSATPQSSNIILQNEAHIVTVDEKPKESVISVKSGPSLLHSKSATTLNANEALNYITEEMQLKAAYELQLWKEAREKEFELQVFIN